MGVARSQNEGSVRGTTNRQFISGVGMGQPLLERGRELSVLGAALQSISRGGSLFYVVGSAGLGKSRLLAEARELANEARLLVLEASGNELEQDLPFGLVQQMFGTDFGAVGTARGRLSIGHGAAVDGLSGVERDSPRRRNRTGIGLTQTLQMLAESVAGDFGRPGALVSVDDAHWSDRGSLCSLVALAERVHKVPLVVLVALRPPQHRLELFARLAGGERVQPLRLAPLTRDAVAELVRGWLGARPERQFVDVCTRASGGNPFLLAELLAELSAQSMRPTNAQADFIEALVPESVLRSVEKWLAGLSEAARSLAAAIAVLGDGTPLYRAAELARLGPQEADEAADALDRAAIVCGGEPLSMKCGLVRSALLAAQPEFSRRRARRRAAELLARDGAAVEDVCGQLLDARAEADPWVVAQLRRAASAAIGRGEPEAAAALLRRAVLEPPAPAERSTVLIELAHAEATAGYSGPSAHLERAAGLAEDQSQRANAFCQLSRLQFARGDFLAAANAAERGLAELRVEHDSGHDLLVAQLTEALLLAATSHPLAARNVPRQLLAEIDGPANGRVPRQAAVCRALAAILGSSGRPPGEVRALVETALADGSLMEDIYGAALVPIATALLAVDELELLLQVCEQAMAAARTRGSVTAVAVANHWQAAARCLMGQLAEAVERAQPAQQIAQAGWTGILAWNTFYLARAAIELGEFTGAEATIAAGLERTDHPLGLAVILEARGRLALARGQYEMALADFLESSDHLRCEPYSSSATFGWRPLAAIAASGLGDDGRAEEWIVEELQRVDGSFAPRVRACVLRAAGVVRADPDLLAESVELLQRSAAALELAHSYVEFGAALRRRGLRIQARGQLLRGLELASAFGAAPLAARARDELAASGARLRRDPQPGRAGLTPSEARVAELAAQHLSGPEIARRLVLTPKTVEWHLGRVYRKLNVHSRTEFYAAWATAADAPGT